MEHVAVNAQLVDRDLAQNEHSAHVLRMRKLALIALFAWPLFGLVDLLIATFVQPESRLWFFWTIRLAGMVPIGIAVWRMFSPHKPSPMELRATEISVLTVLSVLISLTCVEFRGIDSPLALGVITLLVGRGALAADHYKRAIVPVASVALAHPLTLIILAIFIPGIRYQFTQPVSVGGFLVNQLFLFGAAALSLLGGHAMWTLQRKVFEARSLGRYKLIQRIGAGGMGEVWSAHHRTLKRQVAVKILHQDRTVDGVAVARFERGVQATAELTHPNTVRVFDYGVTEDGLCYYAMELLRGSDLGSLLRAERQLAPTRVLSLVLQATRALAEAHARGIVHRDVKPENLFVTSLSNSEEVLKVLDFGLAQVCQPDAALTSEGIAVGTPSYISPEILRGQPADPRSDVYALGCVMYHALAGAPPFVGEDTRHVLMGHMHQKPKPLRGRMQRPIAPAIEAVIMRCLEKDPAKRFANAGELTAELVQAMRGLRSTKSKQRSRAGVKPKAGRPNPSAQAAVEAGNKPQPPQKRLKTVVGTIDAEVIPLSRHKQRAVEAEDDSTRKVLVTSAAVRDTVDPEDADTIIDPGPPESCAIG